MNMGFDIYPTLPGFELATCSRVVHGSDGPAGRVGSRFCRILSGRVSISDFLVFNYFLVPELIWIFENYIRIKLIFNDI